MFYSAVLYSAKLNGKTLRLEDLPELDIQKLKPLEELVSVTGEKYELATVQASELRRFRKAMSVFITRHVSRKDMKQFTTVLEATLKKTNAG